MAGVHSSGIQAAHLRHEAEVLAVRALLAAINLEHAHVAVAVDLLAWRVLRRSFGCTRSFETAWQMAPHAQHLVAPS